MKKTSPYMSYRTLAALRDIGRGRLSSSIEFLKELDQRTLKSILYQRYAIRGNNGHLEFTPKGLATFELFTEETTPRRKKIAPLSETVAHLIRLKVSK